LRRPGTEPKIKFYSEIIRSNVEGEAAKDEVRAALKRTVEGVVRELLQVDAFNLQPAAG
jgi:phosphomannomutase